MAANRSRTQRWREMLDQVQTRGGALEIALRGADEDQPGAAMREPSQDVVWRVRLVEVGDAALVVETPMACGRTISISPGSPLVVALSIGQNRWMFHSKVLAQRGGGGERGTLAIGVPEKVERCSRRESFRISTVQLNLPRVRCWPLLDPTTVVAAEAANRMQVRERMGGILIADENLSLDPMLMPSVGPQFDARLVNMSGGGLGLLLGASEATAADRHPYLWMQLDLRPRIPVPVAITAKRAHSHMDSSGNTYFGMAFDFTHNPEHQPFVFETICRYVDALQFRGAKAA